MSETMIITQALDERDLLIKKITDKIDRAHFVDAKRNNEDTVGKDRMDETAFAKQAEAAYQQIRDLVARFQKIDAAIIASNARTVIQTSYGEFTIAAAISLRNRLRGTGMFDCRADFEGMLLKKMTEEYQDQVQHIEMKNGKLQSTAEQMRLSILGKESKVKDDKPLEVVESYIKENTTVMVNPLNIQQKIDSLKEKRETLLRELDTKIKVSNATTSIEI